MTLHAFKDAADGYYQVDVPDGEPLPEWTEALTPCAVQAQTPEPEQIIAGYVTAMEAHYDAVAKAKGYDNRYTCALRAGYSGPFQTEGQAFAQWMDACNAYAYQELAKIKGNGRAVPTIPGFLSELPSAPW